MSETRPEQIDAHGTRHRFGCTQPGWTSEGAAVVGWHALRCAGCGAVRLKRGGGPR